MNNIINDKEEYKEFHYINNKNAKGQSHGYQEWYECNVIYYRGNMNNNKRIGYGESHVFKTTRFRIR